MKGLTDQDVEKRIDQLKRDPFVRLAKAEERERYRRRQYMYCLQTYQRRGIALAKEGYELTEDGVLINLNVDDFGEDE